ncbi:MULTISPECIES: phosphotransferase family protein [unclassified Rhodococcus (in: high G+C Gram-positive bacteria)]|uniref:phosphotransferase family protein n=1 Tax=unclassified Rhodococcus (in: high G+C Gram-positive bacteria) TaxID=192944 RepID=UPI00163A162A|nr:MULTISPECIES: phosphotransferase family protein [unclassified Rhodococcus (in: high G+C Gram-positive bacteria)]MBC2637618.1 phosphotransferase family protein [Rhodococcus sp. 3A]MBC2897638.1 phosphotransferase family protein [Rhodococcus sp. 4CII]
MDPLTSSLSLGTSNDLEPSIAAMLDRKRHNVERNGDYSPLGTDAVRCGLERFLDREAISARVCCVEPMGGGASNEQYSVELAHTDGRSERLVLRIDAIQGVMESDRQREFDVLHFLEPRFPVPTPRWVESTGEVLGRPFLATSFVEGVAAPTKGSQESVSGLQTVLAGEQREALAEQFVHNLAVLHDIQLSSDQLGCLGVPDDDPRQAARWQVNWWSRVWRDDSISPFPLVAAIEVWLRDNLPLQERLSIVHGDYRTGNYLFDESTNKVTAVLDWELAHVGDPHEDLAWGIQRLYSTVAEDGQRLVTGLMPRERLLTRYEELSGHCVDPVTLHFYEVLCAFKSLVATLASSLKAARDRQSHHDVLLTWLATCGYLFAADIIDMIEKGPR